MPPRRAAPTKAFSPSPKKTVRQDKTVRPDETARPDEAGQRLFAALEGREFSTYVDSFHPQMWKTQEHYPQAVERLFRLLDGQLLPGRRVSLWRVAPKARSPGVPGRVRLPSPAVIGLLPLSSATRRDVGALASAASVTSRLPACSCGFRRSLRPSRSRLARRRP